MDKRKQLKRNILAVRRAMWLATRATFTIEKLNPREIPVFVVYE